MPRILRAALPLTNCTSWPVVVEALGKVGVRKVQLGTPRDFVIALRLETVNICQPRVLALGSRVVLKPLLSLAPIPLRIMRFVDKWPTCELDADEAPPLSCWKNTQKTTNIICTEGPRTWSAVLRKRLAHNENALLAGTRPSVRRVHAPWQSFVFDCSECAGLLCRVCAD